MERDHESKEEPKDCHECKLEQQREYIKLIIKAYNLGVLDAGNNKQEN